MPDWILSPLAHDIGIVALTVGGTTLQGWLAFVRPQKKELGGLVDAIATAWRNAEGKQAEAMAGLEEKLKAVNAKHELNVIAELGQAQQAFRTHEEALYRVNEVFSGLTNKFEEAQASYLKDRALIDKKLVDIAAGTVEMGERTDAKFEQHGQALMELAQRMDQQAEVIGNLIEAMERRPAVTAAGNGTPARAPLHSPGVSPPVNVMGPSPAFAVPDLAEMPARLQSLQNEFMRRRQLGGGN